MMIQERLSQTNPHIVTHQPYSSGTIGFTKVAGTQFYEVKENDPRYSKKFKTAQPEDYDMLIQKKGKIIKKIEYSGGYRVPKESLNKPYMKNKCWKSKDSEDENTKYSKEQIMKKLGLEISEVSKKSQHIDQSRSISPGQKNQKNRMNIISSNSQMLVSEAERKINGIHSRRDDINNKKRTKEEEFKKREKKLILQNEVTHEEVYVTVDSHKIKMIQTYIKQLELQEQIQNLERLKTEKLYTQSNAKMKKSLTLQDQFKIAQKEMNKELKYIELIKNHEIYKVEREKIGDIAKVYYRLNKKDFDLNEFLSPNTERWQKNNAVNMEKNQINPFEHIIFSRDAYILLVERIVAELVDIEKKSQVFNSLNQNKDRVIEKVSNEVIEQFFLAKQDVRDIINLKKEDLSKEFNLKNEFISTSEIKNIIIRITNKEIEKRNIIISSIEQQFHEKINIIKEEFDKYEMLQQLDLELEQARKENEELGVPNLGEKEIEIILDKEEKGIEGEYESDSETQALQYKTIIISKQKRQLQREIQERKQKRCQSADKPRLTVPEPFEIEERERRSKLKKSIRETKLEEMIRESKQKDQKELDFVFKPKEIPEHVLITDLFQQITENNERRREIVIKTSKQMTQENERPFSFYYRDQDKEKNYKNPYWEKEISVFKANSVPKHVTLKLLDKLQKEQEKRRKERVQKRQEELLRTSSLPARMAKHEEEKKAKLLVEDSDDEGTMKQTNKYFTHTFQPPKAKKIPNFDKLHKTFQQELDQKKAQFKSTKIEPFDFEESRKLPNRDYLDQENVLQKMTLDKFYEDKTIQTKKIVFQITKRTQTEPDILPPSTKKSQDIITFRRAQDEIKKKKQKEELDKQKSRERKRDELKKRFYTSNALKNFKEEREEKKRQQDIEKSQEREYQKQAMKEFKTSIKQKVDSKPLLIEKYDKDSSVIEKAIEKWSVKQGGSGFVNKYSQYH